MEKHPKDQGNEELIEQTLEKINTITKEFQKKKEQFSTLTSKTEVISNSLKTSLNLINPDPQSRINHLKEDIKDFVDTTKLEMTTVNNAVKQLTENTSLDILRKQAFKEKLHMFRDSELTVLFQSEKDLKSIYYIVITLLFWLTIYVMIDSAERTGHLIDLNFWIDMLHGFPLFFKIHFCLVVYSNIIVFYVQLIKWFANKNNKINYYVLFIFYFLIQAAIPVFVFTTFHGKDKGLPAGTSMGAEMVRIIMKMHSYFREKILYGLKEYHMEYATFSPSSRNPSGEVLEISIENPMTELKRFWYFFFCPSLIYRDSYPRLHRFRLFSFISYGYSLIICIMFFYVFVMYVCKPYFSISLIKNYYSLTYFINNCLYLSFPSSIFLMGAFFMLLHTWMNFWSEILRHGDRRFYEDWWNCTNFEQYYRKWNMVVHEWLYYYMYNDVRRLSLGKASRVFAQLLVFSVSVTIHEIIIVMGIGFLYPILSIFFGGPGVLFTYIKTTKKMYNVVFWLEMFIGPGVIVVLYLWEFNLRQAFTQIPLESAWHKYIPKILLMFKECYKTKLIELSNSV